MDFPVIQNSANVHEFINSWSKFYHYEDYDEYRRLIAKHEFENEDVLWLYEWKNGMFLSTKKEKSYEKNICPKLSLVLDLKKNFNENLFLKHLGGLSAVWQIFLMHILKPEDYPIFDQHVYRAYLSLSKQEIKTLPYTKNEILEIYHNKYLQFFQLLVKSDLNIDRFNLDKALWVYGKMIKVPKLKKFNT